MLFLEGGIDWAGRNFMAPLGILLSLHINKKEKKTPDDKTKLFPQKNFTYYIT